MAQRQRPGRVHALLEVRSVDDEQRVITGIATSAATDSYGDVVEPDGAEFTLPIPLLWQHDSRAPVGEVFNAKSTKNGIEVQARFAKCEEPGALKDRLDMAWQSVKLKLVRGLSIGFRSLEETYDRETGGFHFIRWAWVELSAVTIPANADATILAIRSADKRHLTAATGRPSTLPGATGSVRLRTTETASMKKSYADQISEWEASRKAKTDRMDALLTKSAEAGVTLDDAETEEHDTLAEEVRKIDAQLVRLKAAQERDAAEAVPATGRTTQEGVQGRQAARVVVVERKLDPGIMFARYAMCVGMSRGSLSDALALAKAHYPNHPQIGQFIERTAVGAGAVVTSHWADDLVPYNILQDFIEYLRPGSIIGKFGTPNPGGGGNYPSLNRVPFNVRVSGFSAGLTGYWVGEGKPTPLSKATSFNTALTWAKCEALSVLTKEEIRFSNPAAESKVRDEIARAVNARLDIDFVDPAKAAVANVSPASITYGIAAVGPTGTTAAKFRADLATLIGAFATANLDPSDIVLIMSATMALNLSMMINTLGNPDFPDITMKGGMIGGFPVIVSEHLTALGSPSTQAIVAVKASDVYLADDGVVTVDASDQASVQMDDAPTQDGIAGTGQVSVSLWQNGLLGLKATREITWKLRRSTAVGYISPAAYVPQ